jgi:MFS transporter, ACS family, D-galactonate transporter
MSSGAAAVAKAPGGAATRWVMIALLFVAILINYIDRGNLSIVAVPIMQQFGITPAGMGALLSAFFWTYALLQVPAGWVVDRFGLRWSYAGAFALWSVASAGVGFAHSFQQVFMLRLLLGIGEAAAQPASLAYIRRNFPEQQQGFATAVYLSGMMIGPALGAFLGAVLLQELGWRLLFIVTGLGALVWLVPWLLLAPSDRQRPRQVATPADTRNGAWRLVLSRPTLWGIAVGAFFYSYYWYFCLTWLPSYLVMARGFSFLKMGAYTALPLLLTAIMSMVFGRIADRVIARTGHSVTVRKRFIAAGFLLGSVIAVVPALSSSEAVLGTLLVSLMGVGVASANYWALTQAASPASMIGRVIGAQNTLANVAGICAPIITGILVGRANNFNVAMFVAGGAMIIAAGSFLFLVRERDTDAFRAMSS